MLMGLQALLPQSRSVKAGLRAKPSNQWPAPSHALRGALSRERVRTAGSGASRAPSKEESRDGSWQQQHQTQQAAITASSPPSTHVQFGSKADPLSPPPLPTDSTDDDEAG